jgi:hypothetical protein
VVQDTLCVVVSVFPTVFAEFVFPWDASNASHHNKSEFHQTPSKTNDAF